MSARSRIERRLVAPVGTKLGDLGYARTPGADDVASGLFYKLVGELILTLGLEISSLYDARFTGSYYLGPSFEWAYMLPDYPEAAFQRIAVFLTREERERLLEPEFHGSRVTDGWWLGFDHDAIESFAEAVSLTESRFVSQPGMREAISASEHMREHVELASHTLSLASKSTRNHGELAYQPKPDPIIPSEYYIAAELVLREAEPELISKEYVALLARDTWRFRTLGRRGGK